jgi:cysteine-rich repeat protein
LPVCGNGIYEPQSASSIINLGQSGVNGYNPNPNVPNSFGFNAYYGEQCDNGNQVGCRGCVIEKDWTCRNVVGQPSICTANIVLPKCGNGIYEPSFGEQCDDGNTNNGDGCNVFCNVEAYWVCPNGINCVLINNYIPSGCGNGMYEPSRG